MKSNIVYTGQVTLKLNSSKSRKVYNNGTIEFFNLLCNILAKKTQSIDSIYDFVPNYIDLYVGTDEGNDLTSLLYQPTSIITAVTETQDDGTPCVTFSALLNSSNLNISNVTRNTENKIYARLLPNTSQHFHIAQVEYADSSSTEGILNELQGIKDMNEQATIMWQLSFSNASSNTNEGE